MEGIIKNYNEERGFGFIRTDNGQDVFFHISNWENTNSPQKDMIVSYSLAESNGRTYATNVKYLTKRQGVVILGNERIKISNIKTYGISYYNEIHQRVHKYKYDDFRTVDEDVDWIPGKELCVLYYDEKGNICKYKPDVGYGILDFISLVLGSGTYTDEDKLEQLLKNEYEYKPLPYLYITTYQGDNYQYFQGVCDFDVKEKAEEIDANI